VEGTYCGLRCRCRRRRDGTSPPPGTSISSFPGILAKDHPDSLPQYCIVQVWRHSVHHVGQEYLVRPCIICDSRLARAKSSGVWSLEGREVTTLRQCKFVTETPSCTSKGAIVSLGLRYSYNQEPRTGLRAEGTARATHASTAPSSIVNKVQYAPQELSSATDVGHSSPSSTIT
jgi:hypothetical protein